MKTVISNGRAVVGQAELVTSRLRQTLGLMFSRQKNLIFVLKREKRLKMHMFFVFYCIDVVFLNIQKEVVELKKDFKPFTFYFARTAASYVLELENQTILEKGIRLGERLTFNPPIDD